MQKKYYELFFIVENRYKNLFLEFVFDLGVEAIEEKDNGIYIRSNESLNELSWALEIFAQKLAISFNLNHDIISNLTLKEKENKDWINEYRKAIKPILIDSVYIHTSWQEEKKEYINIKIDPALAFGSGHHESTYSCVKFLQQFATPKLRVLDLGCGSGILGIVMAKLSCEVEICDTDELAIDSALKNARLNKINFKKTWCGSINKAKGLYGLIVANIVADVILILEKDIKNHLEDNAILILSGILDKYKMRIKKKFQDLELIDELQINEWYSFVYKNNKKDK
ncbi:50S ribosomal protein L11 methyltransferase [Campylobacter hepaticus]|uniref:Ribosomal protein L11 methyltransferase n=1 Tax=Campylobacter hepaticus TaxID=1813019 RepID=A0A424Z1T1_9BACT|nr:50S ribosomal protein L11 methyltransferase [Campylobacter hepaticus]AXP08398.1 50S ribosomal protein L11 methyltransferase [Campylobacter hepaticus]MCZ0772227.1 50S ribosomal protein L11 methyltransferase [Campylobacter hepaticus]MCZ0773695.1 50S ribosomal protein L11 methyltransferase [Campylobacter hepaticus]MCZ0774946.1 50S ribosomal protein L11 methyltransferase [Campylobacter hepaticus]MDX2322814.1 50S ribosomal protein L11 methyltransferase [Campylobacter hepaticus]